ncbi:MAG: hypothetical protein AAGA54_37615 [Myxococcota bacterium]
MTRASLSWAVVALGLLGCRAPAPSRAPVRADAAAPVASVFETLDEVFGGQGAPYADERGDGLVYTFDFAGAARQVRLHFPQGWDPQRPTTVRALFHFHSCGGRTVDNDYYDSFHRTEHGGFLVVTLGAAERCWEVDPALEDVPYAVAVIEGIESIAWVDASRRRLGGMSGGDFMAEVLACRVGADVIVVGSGGVGYPVSAASVTATAAPEPSACVSHPEVFKHHGASDTTVPIALGREARDLWIDVNECTLPVDAAGEPVAMSADEEPARWCHGAELRGGVLEDDSPVPPAPCQCFTYDCAHGSLTYCEDAGGHVWYPQHKLVGEAMFGRDGARGPSSL